LGNVINSFLESKTERDWLTSVIFSGHINHFGGSEEPTFNGLTVKSSHVFTSRGSLESTFGLFIGLGNGGRAPLIFLVHVFDTWDEFKVGSSDITDGSVRSSGLSWHEVDPSVTHTWASTLNNSSGSSRFISLHSESHGWVGWFVTGLSGSNSNDSRREGELSFVSTVKLILKFFTSNSGSTFESKSTRSGSNVKSNESTLIWSNTFRVVSGLVTSLGGRGFQGNLNIREWSSSGSNNNWDGRSTKSASNFVWDINSSSVTVNSGLKNWKVSVSFSTVINSPVKVMDRLLGGGTSTEISTSFSSTHSSSEFFWVKFESGVTLRDRNSRFEVT